MRKFGDHRPLEPVAEVERPLVVLTMVGKDGQRQLRRAAAVVAPFKPGRTVIPQVQPVIELVAVHRDGDDISLPDSFVALHRKSPRSCCTSSAVRCSGSMSGWSKACTLTKQNLDRRQAMSSRPARPASFSSSMMMT